MNAKKKKRAPIKVLLPAFAPLAAIGFAVACWVTYHAVGPHETTPPIAKSAGAGAKVQDSTVATPRSLRLMTLNIAHGRKSGPHQALQTKRSIESNLNDIAAMLRRRKPDLVALQEADGPSAFTGKFDHVQYLADKAEYAFSMRGEHLETKRFSSGTALLSVLALHHPLSVTFAPSPPTFPKGFVRCTVAWPGETNVQIDVVSVHFDFSRKSVRRKQVQELIDHLADHPRPLIVMGDLNCQWTDKGSALRTLAEALDLQAHRPEAADLKTFPKLKRRLDWILISPELSFSDYQVLEEVVSDHRAVISEVSLTAADE